MLPHKLISSPSNFIVDPDRDGVANALWFANTGTLALAGTAPDRFRFNADDGIVRTDLRYATVAFAVNIPLTGVQTVTNLVNDIAFGLKNVSLDTLGKIDLFFDKSENTATFRTYDDFGTVETTAITYATAWNGVRTLFEFGWTEEGVTLYVVADGGTSRTTLAKHTTSTPSRPLNPFVTVVGAEDLDVYFIAVKNAQSSSIMLV